MDDEKLKGIGLGVLIGGGIAALLFFVADYSRLGACDGVRKLPGISVEAVVAACR